MIVIGVEEEVDVQQLRTMSTTGQRRFRLVSQSFACDALRFTGQRSCTPKNTLFAMAWSVERKSRSSRMTHIKVDNFSALCTIAVGVAQIVLPSLMVLLGE